MQQEVGSKTFITYLHGVEPQELRWCPKVSAISWSELSLKLASQGDLQ